ncbi:MAG: hypothetical protein IJS10_01945 [Alphaproteobacteria bacterium]|nr:hypothetical protein [Alphaproteobacteria bacterium]
MNVLKFFAISAICLYGEYTDVLACDDVLDDPIEIESKNLVLSGKYFEPREFWQKSMEEKLCFLAKPIIENKLCDMVAKHYWWFNMQGFVCTFVAPEPKPYTPEEVMKFQNAIWSKLKEYVLADNLQLSKDDFIKSLRTNIHPESRVYDAPLIHHFESRLFNKASFEMFIQENNLDK